LAGALVLDPMAEDKRRALEAGLGLLPPRLTVGRQNGWWAG
jgi:hypothetical protein